MGRAGARWQAQEQVDRLGLFCLYGKQEIPLRDVQVRREVGANPQPRGTRRKYGFAYCALRLGEGEIVLVQVGDGAVEERDRRIVVEGNDEIVAHLRASGEDFGVGIDREA